MFNIVVPPSPQQIKKLLKEVVGQHTDMALFVIEADGLEVRLAEVDGVASGPPDDGFRTDRINLVVRNDVVVGAQVG